MTLWDRSKITTEHTDSDGESVVHLAVAMSAKVPQYHQFSVYDLSSGLLSVQPLH